MPVSVSLVVNNDGAAVSERKLAEFPTVEASETFVSDLSFIGKLPQSVGARVAQDKQLFDLARRRLASSYVTQVAAAFETVTSPSAVTEMTVKRVDDDVLVISITLDDGMELSVDGDEYEAANFFAAELFTEAPEVFVSGTKTYTVRAR